MLATVELSLFDEVADVLTGLVPRPLGRLRYRSRSGGIKVWFEDETPPREHYEAQFISRHHVPEATQSVLEVGFHAEHPSAADNDAVADRLRAAGARWRPQLGDPAVLGEFLGRAGWRRLSETWPDPDPDVPELALEVALRLTDYITALEPIRRAH